MKSIYSQFKRKFSMSMHKNLKIKLGEMTFTKDFINDNRGDLYPVLQKSNDCVETVHNNIYTLEKGDITRLFCQFFPYANYELTANVKEGKTGFSFRLPDCNADILISENKLIYSCCDVNKETDLPDYLQTEFTIIVGCRPGAFDIYLENNAKAEYFCTFYEENFSESNEYSLFSDSYVALKASGSVVVKAVMSYIDNGISIADMRPIRYENSEVMLDGGKIYITASIRIQEYY